MGRIHVGAGSCDEAKRPRQGPQLLRGFPSRSSIDRTDRLFQSIFRNSPGPVGRIRERLGASHGTIILVLTAVIGCQAHARGGHRQLPELARRGPIGRIPGAIARPRGGMGRDPGHRQRLEPAGPSDARNPSRGRPGALDALQRRVLSGRQRRLASFEEPLAPRSEPGHRRGARPDRPGPASDHGVRRPLRGDPRRGWLGAPEPRRDSATFRGCLSQPGPDRLGAVLTTESAKVPARLATPRRPGRLGHGGLLPDRRAAPGSGGGHG